MGPTVWKRGSFVARVNQQVCLKSALGPLKLFSFIWPCLLRVFATFWVNQIRQSICLQFCLHQSDARYGIIMVGFVRRQRDSVAVLQEQSGVKCKFRQNSNWTDVEYSPFFRSSCLTDSSRTTAQSSWTGACFSFNVQEHITQKAGDMSFLSELGKERRFSGQNMFSSFVFEVRVHLRFLA